MPACSACRERTILLNGSWFSASQHSACTLPLLSRIAKILTCQPAKFLVGGRACAKQAKEVMMYLPCMVALLLLAVVRYPLSLTKLSGSFGNASSGNPGCMST